MTTRRSFLAASLAASITPAFAAAKKPKLLLKSGWQTVNIGDIAHTPGMLRLLAETLPGVEVVLWPNSIGDGVKEMLAKNFPAVSFAQTADEVAKAFDECAFCLHGSGPSLVAEKAMATWAETTKKPYGVLGITLGSTTPELATLLNGAKFVYLRDSLSVKFAKEKLATPVIDFAPDAAFHTALRDDAKAEALLEKHGLEAGKFLCVVPKFRNTPYWLIHGKPMTDADRAKDKRNQEMKESDFAKVRPAVVEVLRRTPHKVLLCPEDKSHIAIHKEMIHDRLPEDLKSRAVWKPDYWLTDEAVSVYGKSLGLLSMDMHSPILCVGNGIPAIHCRFKEQTTKGIMWSDIGLGDWLFDLDAESDGTRIAEATLAMLTDREGAGKKVAAARKAVKETTDAAIKVLKASLG
jgi:polysaccharide pyruvyl transferase WcaK-like protein